ncbi:MAG: Hpt domain-containing protein [Oscillibacter sp.]|jgi:HPt (histidine-containing phosphotransfer) domain-containing protein|nr:Hpt domain-containing protein [Oscillibacter sp.]
MSELTERLRAYGADMKGAMARFLDDEALYAECLNMFLTDPEFVALETALDEKNYSAAFDAAHTLKGVAGNLGLTPLFNAICEIVEPLRHQDYSHLDEEFQKIIEARAAVEKLK